VYVKQEKIGISQYSYANLQVRAVSAVFTRGLLACVRRTNGRYHKETHEIVAIKVIDLDYAEDDVDDIMKEIAILAQLNSKYVTRLTSSSDTNEILWLLHQGLTTLDRDGILWRSKLRRYDETGLYPRRIYRYHSP
jgi:hypothetical protein